MGMGKHKDSSVYAQKTLSENIIARELEGKMENR